MPVSPPQLSVTALLLTITLKGKKKKFIRLHFSFGVFSCTVSRCVRSVFSRLPRLVTVRERKNSLLALAPPPQDQIKAFNRNRRFFCAVLTNRCCSAVGHVFDADTVVFYDTDLNPSMDARTQEWCDKVGRSKDIHIYRCVHSREACLDKGSFLFLKKNLKNRERERLVFNKDVFKCNCWID